MKDEKLFIADGHHRYETAVNYMKEQPGAGAANYVMMMCVSMQNEGLEILPTHRLVYGVEGFDAASFMEALKNDFSVEEADEGALLALEKTVEGPIRFGLGLKGDDRKYLVTFNNESALDEALPAASAAYKGLDVAVLHTLILDRLLGIDKAKLLKKENINYIKSGAGLFKELAGTDGAQLAFLTRPTRVDQVKDVAAGGERMPQKSTYFYPKLLTGLVINSLEA